MVERLAEIGKVLAGIGDAIKTMKLLRDNNSELYRLIDDTKKHAGEVVNLDLREPLLLELKDKVKKVQDSGLYLEDWIKKSGERIHDFEKFVDAKLEGATFPTEAVKELCDELNKMHEIAKTFFDTFDTFVRSLCDSQVLALKLTEKLKQSSEETDQAASSSRNWGIAGTVGLTALTAALGFFTGGSTWIATGAILYSGVSAGSLALMTRVNVNATRKLADEIKANSHKLGAIASKLKISSDKAGAIPLNKEAVTALRTALEFFRRDLKKDDLLAQKNEVIESKDAEIAQLKEQLRQQSLNPQKPL